MKEAKKHIQNWKDISIADITKLSKIRKPAFKKGDRKFMTLLPSFNETEPLTGKEIPTNHDYLITGVKRLTSFDSNFFLFLWVGFFYGLKKDKI